MRNSLALAKDANLFEVRGLGGSSSGKSAPGGLTNCEDG